MVAYRPRSARRLSAAAASFAVVLPLLSGCLGGATAEDASAAGSTTPAATAVAGAEGGVEGGAVEEASSPELTDAPLAWVQQSYPGTAWQGFLDHTETVSTEPVESGEPAPESLPLLVYTTLDAGLIDSDPTIPAMAWSICNAFASYQIVRLGRFAGVRVLDVGGAELAAREPGTLACA